MRHSGLVAVRAARPPEITGVGNGNAWKFETTALAEDFRHFEVRTAVETGNPTISIFDYIGDDGDGGGVNDKRIAAALRSIGNRDVDVEINSPGGNYFQGVAIYNLFRRHPKAVNVQILGIAASAASVIAMAGDTISIAHNAEIMIHEASGIFIGTKSEMAEAVTTLEHIDDSMVATYAARSGRPAEEFAAMIAGKDVYFRGQEAIDAGLADKLMDRDAEMPVYASSEYAHFVFRTTGLSKKAESPFSSGIPARITIIGKGAMLYDVRRDSTAGGSGSMRASDQSTWRYTADDGADIGENLALLILRVLLGWTINGKLATGCGLPAKRINLASFLVAANQCDELVNRSIGGTEPRYRGAGVMSEGDDPRTVLDALCAACSGRLRDTQGRLSLVIMHNDLALAAVDEGLNADDVIGAFTWNLDPSMDQTPNVVRGKYTDPSTASLYQMLPYPDVSIPTNTGIERAMSLDLAVVESPSQAQRIAKQALQRRQYDRSFTAPFDIRAWKYPVGSPVPFTFPPLGFVRQIFRVTEQEVGPGGICNMTLSFETEEIYRWDADDRAPVRAATAVIYDPTKAALVQAIDAANTAAEATAGTVTSTIIQNSAPIEQGFITSTDAGGGTANVTIAAHTRRYGDKDVAVAGGVISGLLNASYYDIGYDDPARAGGAVTYIATMTPQDARLSSDHPARHYVGYVTTAATGGASTGGGGATPPGGGYCVTVDSLVLMADGAWTRAGDLQRGDRVRTQHETTMAWGDFTVSAVSIVREQVMAARGYPDATPEHRFWTEADGWFRMERVGSVVGWDDVVRITVLGARTYIARHPDHHEGILSHNIKQNEQIP